jgi:hypothetical protein
MNIPALGPLKPHPKVPEWLRSPPVAVPYFDGRELTFTFDSLEESDAPEANAAIEAFLRLGRKDRLAAAQYVFANYQAVAESVSEEDLACDIRSREAVWEHVHPSEVLVSRRHRRERAIYVQIAAECDWEPEHGLQVVYRRGSELSRVSAQDGHLTHADAYDVPEDQDKIA